MHLVCLLFMEVSKWSQVKSIWFGEKGLWTMEWSEEGAKRLSRWKDAAVRVWEFDCPSKLTMIWLAVLCCVCVAPRTYIICDAMLCLGIPDWQWGDRLYFQSAGYDLCDRASRVSRLGVRFQPPFVSSCVCSATLALDSEKRRKNKFSNEARQG